MQPDLIKNFIIIGTLFFIQGTFFVQSALQAGTDRYRKIFVRIVSIYLGIIVIATLIKFLLSGHLLLTFSISLLVLLLPVVISASMLGSRYNNLDNTVRTNQLYICIFIGLVSVILFIEDVSFAVSLIAGIYATIISWKLYFNNERIIEIANKNKEIAGTKSEFLSFTTHQLRSPLTQLKWGLGTVAENVADRPDVAKIVAQLRTTSDEMINTVNDLLDISKIEQGGMTLKKESFDLIEFLDRIAEEFRAIAEMKGLRLHFESRVATAPIFADRTKLRQVINNLVDNSIKYTVSGSVAIVLEKSEAKESYTISVIDTGAGITVDEIPNLFLKFSRGNAGKIFMGGSGLGLYLARKITEMHEGTISVYSSGLGTGSTFIVTLPIPKT